MAATSAVRRTLAVIVMLAGLTAAAAFIPVDSPRDGAATWVSTLSQAARIQFTAPDRLAEMPLEYRKSLYATLPTSDDRAAFWRNILTTYSMTHPLSLSQRTSLAQAEALLSPDLFNPDAPQEARTARAAAIASIVVAALGAPAAEELLVAGAPRAPRGHALPVAERIRHYWRAERPVRLAEAWLGRFAPTLHARVWYCDCNIQSECSGHQNCDPGEACNLAEIGCGWLWLGECHYKCTFPHNY